MKRVIIICEGPTETEFCKDVLSPHFIPRDIHIQTPLIKSSGGGIVAWNALHKQIVNHLLQDPSLALVTTFIDYYGIKDKHDFPGWNESKTKPDRNSRMNFLEQKLLTSLPEPLRHRVHPYIQLHEFEGLLFSEGSVFQSLFMPDEFDHNAIEKIIQQYANPEMINDGPESAPSYRLKASIRGYNKIVYGAIIGKQIGLNRIRAKCPRFNNWINSLEHA